jgi:carboxyl-terminal processing protease
MNRFFILALTICLTMTQAPAQDQAPDQKQRFEQLEIFNKVLHLVENQYYRTVDRDKLIEGALKGMMETLDPHSAFLNKDYFQRMQNDTSGEFSGLGVEVALKDGVIVVLTPIEDSPAQKAGIRPKDRIVEINHENIVGMTLDQAIERMRGKVGAIMHLGVSRDGHEGLKHFNIKREVIKVNPVKTQMLQQDIAYVRLSQFQKRASQTVEEALVKLSATAKNKGGLAGIILDLRANPGGLLDQAVDLSSLFLREGIVVSTEARDPQNKDIRYVKKQGWKDLKTPVVVLINGSSASASEIVAGALQDHGRAIIMGSQSFGKGSVQSVAPLDGETGIKLTIAQYLTPKGRRIQGIGITPDILVDDVDPALFARAKRADRWMREKDLRNHLGAGRETDDEKKQREAQEKDDRIARQTAIQKRQAALKETVTDEDSSAPVKPEDDFQIGQASALLKAMRVIEAGKPKA